MYQSAPDLQMDQFSAAMADSSVTGDLGTLTFLLLKVFFKKFTTTATDFSYKSFDTPDIITPQLLLVHISGSLFKTSGRRDSFVIVTCLNFRSLARLQFLKMNYEHLKHVQGEVKTLLFEAFTFRQESAWFSFPYGILMVFPIKQLGS